MRLWDDEGSDSLYLFTVDEFNKLPDGIELECISGKCAVKGRDKIDLDIRGGCIAYGVRRPFEHQERHLFLTFILME